MPETNRLINHNFEIVMNTFVWRLKAFTPSIISPTNCRRNYCFNYYSGALIGYFTAVLWTDVLLRVYEAFDRYDRPLSVIDFRLSTKYSFG